MRPAVDGPAALAPLAGYFAALAEPTRLQMLQQLRGGECSVGELAMRCGRPVATVSRHLALLARAGIVVREARGASVYYRIADEAVHALCGLVCDAVAREATRRAAQGRALAEHRPAPPR